MKKILIIGLENTNVELVCSLLNSISLNDNIKAEWFIVKNYFNANLIFKMNRKALKIVMMKDFKENKFDKKFYKKMHNLNCDKTKLVYNELICQNAFLTVQQISEFVGIKFNSEHLLNLLECGVINFKSASKSLNKKPTDYRIII